MKTENVRIIRVSLSMADHGCLTFDIFVDGDGWSCAIGGYCIGHGYLGADEFIAENGHGLEATMHIMNVIGVDRWENLEGKYCCIQSEGWGSPIKIIGNIIEDKWFDIGKFFEEKQNEEKISTKSN